MDCGEIIIQVERSLERLIIASSGLVSIYLGYLLFKITSENGSSGGVSAKGFSVRLKQVGPGVFFCAFGSSVLIFIASQNVSTKTVNFSTKVSHETSSALGVSKLFILDDIEALDRLIEMAGRTKNADKDLELTAVLAEAAGTKIKMVVALYGEEFADWYFRIDAAKNRDQSLFIQMREAASSDWNRKYETLQRIEQGTIKN